MTLQATLAAARARLIAGGVSESEAPIDVDLFARTALGWDRARLLASLMEPTPQGLEPRFSEFLARRERREPSAYIVGVREFWGLDFRVTPAVLIPRPETEFIVEEAARMLRAADAPRVADIGTGSGNIAVSLAYELPRCTILASDVSGEALAIARDNAQRHGVDERITFVETSYLDGVTESFDLIVSNPPYVKSGDKRALSIEVRHEPDVALFGGADGMLHVDGVLDTATARLRPGGWLLMEFGFGQDDRVLEVIERKSGLRLERIADDLQGIPRTAILQKAER